MQRWIACVICATGLIWSADAVRGQDPERQDPIVPVYHEPHHRQVFQYGPVRILDLQLPPGDISWFHSHESPVLYVTLGTSQTRTQNLGEEWGGRGRAEGTGRAGRAGQAGAAAAGGASPAAPAPSAPPAPAAPRAPRATSTTSYAKQPITHRLQNIGDGLFRAMVVINETPGDDTTSETAAGFDGKPEMTNPWFRAYRIVLDAGQKTAAHVHRAPVAVIQATSGTARGAGAVKWDFNEPGQWAYFDTGDRHEIRNTGAGPVELIEVEVRGVKPTP